jgi:GTPase SAR1 family protein
MIDAIFKIVIFGDSGSGKTTLTKRFKTDVFISDSQMTIGVDFETKTFKIDGKKIKLMIWEFGGGGRFRFILPEHLTGAKGVNGRKEQIPIVLLGGKSDLDIIRQISFKEGKKIAKARGFSGFTECSSWTGENVEKSFKNLTRLMLNRF